MTYLVRFHTAGINGLWPYKSLESTPTESVASLLEFTVSTAGFRLMSSIPPVGSRYLENRIIILSNMMNALIPHAASARRAVDKL